MTGETTPMAASVDAGGGTDLVGVAKKDAFESLWSAMILMSGMIYSAWRLTSPPPTELRERARPPAVRRATFFGQTSVLMIRKKTNKFAGQSHAIE